MAWTRETLASLRRALASRVEAAPYWTDLEAQLALNEALECWNLLTGTWVSSQSVVIGLGDPFLSVSAGILFNTRVTHQNLPLAKSSLADLFRGRPGWWNELTTAGGDTPTTPKVWAPVSLTLLAVWPQPAIPQTLVVTGAAATPILTEDSGAVDLDDGVIDSLVDYALHVLAFKEGWARFSGTQALMQGFLKAAAEQNSQLNASGAFRAYLGMDAGKGLRRTKDAPERLSAIVGGGNPTAGG